MPPPALSATIQWMAAYLLLLSGALLFDAPSIPRLLAKPRPVPTLLHSHGAFN
jgi:hypothetical protein